MIEPLDEFTIMEFEYESEFNNEKFKKDLELMKENYMFLDKIDKQDDIFHKNLLEQHQMLLGLYIFVYNLYFYLQEIIKTM